MTRGFINTKKASGLSSDEVGFQRSILEHTGYIVCRWSDLVDLDDVNLGRDKASRLGQYLYNAIYQECWVRTSADGERPPVQIPDKVKKLGKYVRPVIYYVTGWTLYSASRALTISLQEREKYLLFVQRNNTTKDDTEKVAN